MIHDTGQGDGCHAVTPDIRQRRQVIMQLPMKMNKEGRLFCSES
jgi:hypothetical protein